MTQAPLPKSNKIESPFATRQEFSDWLDFVVLEALLNNSNSI